MACTRLTSTLIVEGCCAEREPERKKMQARRTALPCNWNILVPLSFDPDFAVDEVFLFPDGDDFLQAVDAFEGSVESGTAMGRGHDDRDAGFADQQTAEAVDHRDLADVMAGGDFASDLCHHLQRHGFVA